MDDIMNYKKPIHKNSKFIGFPKEKKIKKKKGIKVDQEQR